MRHRIFIGLALILGAIVFALFGRDRMIARNGRLVDSSQAISNHTRSPVSPIEDLNYHIQDRLHNAEGMGGTRIPTTPEHRRISFPDYSYGFFVDRTEYDRSLAQEEAFIADLQRGGWTVNLYLAGRSLLDPSMSEVEWSRALVDEMLDPRRGEASPFRTIGPPLVITNQGFREALPKPRELWEIGQRALRAAEVSDRYATTFGSWSVDVRPVRADREDCLNCHKTAEQTSRKPPEARSRAPLKVGDPLGVAIYVYRRKP